MTRRALAAASLAAAVTFSALPAQPASATLCDGGCVRLVTCLLLGCSVPPPPGTGICLHSPDLTVCL